VGIAVTALVACALTLWVLAIRRRFEAAPVEVVFDPTASALISETVSQGRIRGIACAPALEADGLTGAGMPLAGDDQAAIFLEVRRVTGGRAQVCVTGRRLHGYRILKIEATRPGRAIALVLLAIRNAAGVAPHIEFAWPAHSHARAMVRFALLGTGNEAAVTREILRRAEPDPSRQPIVRIG
jgi:hypothetical protein